MKTSAKRAPPTSDPSETLRALIGRIARLHDEAVATILPARVEQTLRQWLAHRGLDRDDPEDRGVAALALVMAIDLESVTPSHSGSTAIDRLARRRALDPNDTAALRIMTAARFTPYVIRGSIGGGLFSADDLATRQAFTIFAEHLPPAAIGATLIGWLCALDDGTRASFGVITPLDDAGLAVALDFVRPGRGIPHGHRCAAAVFRHAVRHGGPRIDGLHGPADEEEGEGGPTPLDALAAQVVKGGEVGRLTAEILDEARRLVSCDAVIEAVFKAHRLAELGHADIGAVFRRFAEVMIEALHLRALAGSGLDRAPLDSVARVIDDAVASGDYPREAARLFRDIRRIVTAIKPRQAGDDLTRVIERIRGLRAKTVDQGCTEEEALSAADKVAELLDRYGLSLGEIDLRGQACEGMAIDSDRKRSGPLDDVTPSVAQFCDCRSWSEQTPGGTIRSVFFGLPADVEAARYLYERVVAALDTETAAFRKDDLYRSLAGGGRQKATSSFQLGLVRGIGTKLRARKAERDAKTFATSGRDLVPIKASVVEDELAKLGMSFTVKASNRSRMVLTGAFEAGQVASGRFEIQSELT